MAGLTILLGLVSVAAVVGGGESSIRAAKDSESASYDSPASLFFMTEAELSSHHRSHHRNQNHGGSGSGSGNGSGGSTFHKNGGSSSSQSKSGVFDFYVFSMTHQPEFCREHANAFAGCRKYDEDWEGSLTIHGLWPQFGDGTWPSSCTNEAFDTTLEQNPKLATQMEKRWPNIKSLSPTSKSHDSFWEHEWSKHGTCTGLTQVEYFEAALGLFLPTPEPVRSRYGHTVAKEVLMNAYGGSKSAVAICNFRNESFEDDGVGYLSEVRVCFEKNDAGGPGERMLECPDSVLNEGSCGDMIKIAAFSDTTAQS